MENGDFQRLLAHMEWADSLTWKTVSSLQDGSQDSRLLDLLYHLHVVQCVYLQMWLGEPLKVPGRNDFADLGAVLAWARPYYESMRAFAADLHSRNLSHVITIPWADELVKRFGSAAPTTLGECILQVVLHSTHHRAQVASRIRELGGDAPQVDFIAWVWRAKPDPTW